MEFEFYVLDEVTDNIDWLKFLGNPTPKDIPVVSQHANDNNETEHEESPRKKKKKKHKGNL